MPTILEKINNALNESKLKNSTKGIGYSSVKRSWDKVSVHIEFNESFREGLLSKDFDKQLQDTLNKMEEIFLKFISENE